jgi:2-polyprenyl-3-methyl-5-hydroxy-6-metoxy-1,4-benzoquinol methylase
MASLSAEFIERDRCVACGSDHLIEVASGRFADEPLRSFLEKDPWGESPLPYVEHERWHLAACMACGQKFHRRVLSSYWNEVRFTTWITNEAIQRFAEPVDTPAWRFELGRAYAAHVLRIEKATRPLRGDRPVRLLDFGCGGGEFLWMCKSFGFDAHGIDRSLPRRRGVEGIHVVPDLESLRTAPGGASSFHAVTLFEVLEHLDAPYETLVSLCGLLAPGGLLVLETPDCTGVEGIRTEREYRQIHPLDHINAFTPSSLRAIARRSGFRPIRPPAAHVTTELRRVARAGVRRAIDLLRPRTQAYFVKASAAALRAP